MTEDTQIGAARMDDAADVPGLLASHHLPHNGLREHLPTTLVTNVPATVQASIEFTTAGPSTVTVRRKSL